MPEQNIESGDSRFFNYSKLKNYLSYSIGEIVLIVVGILLAFQVDTWNEIRQENKVEEESLQRMTEDLEADKLRFEMLDSTYSRLIQDSKKAVELFEEAKSMEDLKTISELPSWTNLALAYQTSTYEEMINTGTLFTIENKKLLKLITSHYKNLEKYNDYTEENHRSLLKKWDHPAFSPFGELSLQTMNDGVLYDINSYDEKAHDWINKPGSETYKAVKYTLKFHLHTVKINRDIVLKLIQETTKLLDHIEKDLKQRN